MSRKKEVCDCLWQVAPHRGRRHNKRLLKGLSGEPNIFP